MNVISVPTPLGPMSFTESQIKAMREALGLPPPPAPPQDGIPDFRDDEVQMIIEDGGDAGRALRNRKYH